MSVYDLNAPYKQEDHLGLIKTLFDNCPDEVNLYGYFQSERYFKHIEKEIREDFTFKPEVQKLCKDILEEIVNDEGYTEAIGLHVRRTDHLIKPLPSSPSNLLLRRSTWKTA